MTSSSASASSNLEMSSSSSTSSSSAAPRLSEDLLYMVAEKMLFLKHGKEPFGGHKVDLRHENAFTSFMSVDKTMFRVFMAQFARVKEIHFGNGESRIEMFRDSDKAWKNNKKDEQFYGPYLVTEAFVRALVDLRKLNLTSLSTTGYLDKFANSEQIKPGNSAIQSFCNLFLNKKLSAEEASEIRFELDKLEVRYEGNKVLGSTFGELLNLNAKTVKIELQEPKLFDCSSFDRSINAKGTEKFSLKLPFSTGYDSDIADLKLNWESLVEFLLDKCSAIRKIKFTIKYELLSYDDNAEFVAHFEEMKQKFTEEIYPGLEKGNPEAQISVSLDLTCNTDQYMELTEMSKDVFENGDFFDRGTAVADVADLGLPEAYCTNGYEVTDKLGRVHEFAVELSAFEASVGSEQMKDYMDEYEAEMFEDNDEDFDADAYDEDYGDDGAYGDDDE